MGAHAPSLLCGHQDRLWAQRSFDSRFRGDRCEASRSQKRVGDGRSDNEHTCADHKHIPNVLFMRTPAFHPSGPASVEIRVRDDCSRLGIHAASGKWSRYLRHQAIIGARVGRRCAIGDTAAKEGPGTLVQVKTMLKTLTRSKPVQVWFASIALIVVVVVASGASVSASTSALLFALSLVLLAIVIRLLPGARSKTAADVLYGSDRRG